MVMPETRRHDRRPGTPAPANPSGSTPYGQASKQHSFDATTPVRRHQDHIRAPRHGGVDYRLDRLRSTSVSHPLCGQFQRVSVLDFRAPFPAALLMPTPHVEQQGRSIDTGAQSVAPQMTLETIAPLSEDPLVGLPAVAA